MFKESARNCKNGWFVGYTPMAAGDLVAEAIVAATANNYNDNKFQATALGFPTEASLLDGFYQSQGVAGQEGCKLGIVFTDFNVTAAVHYDLRFEATPGGYQKKTEHDKDEISGIEQFLPGATWLTDKAFPFFSVLGARNDMELLAPQRPSEWGNAPGYFKFGYLMWQHALNTAILESVGADTTAYTSMRINRMPYPPYTEDFYVHAVQFGLPLLLMLAMLYTALLIASSVVREKEHGLKIALEMVGVPDWIHWMGWFLTHGAVLLFAISPIAIAVSRGHALEYVGPGAFYIFLLTYALSSISFCFFVSTFFHKASSAAAGAGICWFMSYSPYFFVFPRYVETSAGLKGVLSLLPNTAMALGANIIALREATGEGVTLSNWDTRLVEDDPYTFKTVITMLLFDAVLYLLLAMYVEKLNPGAYGIPRPWYFPLLPLLPLVSWIQGGSRRRRSAASSSDDSAPLLGGKSSTVDRSGRAMAFSPTTVYNPSFAPDAAAANPSRFEPEPRGGRVGIQIDGVRREFGTRVAVANSTLNVYHGQITSLLGHNGAGKTTTLQLITGMIPATAGTVRVDGHDVATDTLEAQRAVTVCHQHDVLFPSLTSAEHMWLFARLKGVPVEIAEGRVAEMMAELGLSTHADAIATTLSGGQKRRLGVGMALVGQSKVVFLSPRPSHPFSPDHAPHKELIFSN
jgi:ATP-binding cassette subfamily A (ABC1) protein 3